VHQRTGGDEGRFGRLEGRRHRGSPYKGPWLAGQSIRQGTKDGGSGRNKTPVEVNDSQKTLQLFDVRRQGERFDGLQVGGEGGDTSLRNHVAEEIHGRLGKHALRRVYHQPILRQHNKQLPDVGLVFLQCSTRNEVVINVRENPGEAAKKAVHQPLETLCCVFQPEWHENIFEEAERS
jgi:hypothetical protein